MNRTGQGRAGLGFVGLVGGHDGRGDCVSVCEKPATGEAVEGESSAEVRGAERSGRVKG